MRDKLNLSLKRSITLLVTMFTLINLSVLQASAHLDFKNTKVAAGAHTTLTLEVADGCSKGDTTQVDVLMPANLEHVMLTGVKLGSTSLKGWSMKLEKVSGKTLLRAKGPAVKVSDAKPLNLNFMASMPNKKGLKLAFPTTQYCGKEINSWVDPRPAGNSEPEEGTYPVPTITLTSKSASNTSMPKGM